jgi:translation initiation factor IF-2
MRVYEFSKKYDKLTKDVLGALEAGGFEVGSHMSVLSDDAIKYLEKQFLLASVPQAKMEDVGGKVLAKRNNKGGQRPLVETNEEEVFYQPKPIFEVKKDVRVPKKITAEPMLLGDLAGIIGVPASSLIIFLLKQGVACNINQLLTKNQVLSVATQFELEVCEPAGAIANKKIDDLVKGDKARLPVVVVIGHVDHGKTTLLDYIRKTRVAAKEKGGITQHLGAYRVNRPGGSMVFLDTPGHEAFVSIRKRGLKVADIAILMVAADDGVMPQTVEAIRQAQEVGLPIIVAINKIDKVGDAQVEKIKTQLSQYGLTPEEWGGNTILVKISAKEGTNIDELLDMVTLQAEMMELTANLDIPACGYVLESKIEKGRGPVATFIVQHGFLRVGDFFVAGNTTGKVVSLKDYAGNGLLEVGPSVPVGISGFDLLPRAGDYLRVVSELEYRKIKSEFVSDKVSAAVLNNDANFSGDAKIKVFIKSDTVSTEEAIIGAIKKLSKEMAQDVLIVGATVGDINEGDIGYADSVGAVIYGFGVKLATSAAAMAKNIGVSVDIFNIIYKLIDHLQAQLEKNKVAKVVKKKIGEISVKKVFNIKGVGVIAGVHVKKGKIIRGCEGLVLRHGKKIGGGPISSLQRDRNAVKEIVAGYEGAFIIEGFTDWLEGDVVECFIEE